MRPLPLRSVHVVPVPGYDAVLPASSRSWMPLVTIVGTTGALVHKLNVLFVACAIVAVAPCVVVAGKATLSVPAVPSSKVPVPEPSAEGIT